jgi:HNH endonuclease
VGRPKREIVVGTQFGNLITTGETYTAFLYGYHQAMVAVHCACGRDTIVRAHGVLRQGQVSCNSHCPSHFTPHECAVPDCHEKHYGRGLCKKHLWGKYRTKLNTLHRQWMKEHPEARRAYKARRRMRSRQDMDKLDIELSIAYRKAIANDLCFYCGRPGEHDDHYVPLAIGGTDHWWNLVRACRLCNQHKHAQHGDDFIANT